MDSLPPPRPRQPAWRRWRDRNLTDDYFEDERASSLQAQLHLLSAKQFPLLNFHQASRSTAYYVASRNYQDDLWRESSTVSSLFMAQHYPTTQSRPRSHHFSANTAQPISSQRVMNRCSIVGNAWCYYASWKLYSC